MSDPRPTPLTPASGLSHHAAEMRRRIVADLLPHFTDVDDLLEVAQWVERGDDS